LGQKYNCDQTKGENAKEKRRGQLRENGSLKDKIYLQKAKKMREKYTGILAEGENIIFWRGFRDKKYVNIRCLGGRCTV
jgi:hypothetical protein